MVLNKIVINADDFGISNEVNNAILYSFKNKIIDRTTIMVNMDCCEDAVKISKENGFFENVGLHLNLVEGIPLTEDIKHMPMCKDGVFDERFFKNTKNRFYLNKSIRRAVKKEVEEQIKKYLSYGFPLCHTDSHQHSHTNPSVYFILKPLLKKYGIKTVRLSRNIPKSEISGLKSLYKNILNLSIKKHNKKYGKDSLAAHTAWFGSQSDVDKITFNINKYDGIIEMEAHPCVNEKGEVIELFSDVNLETWISDQQSK